MKQTNNNRVALLIVGPLSIWALHFGVLYAVQHVVCATTPSTAHVLLTIATVLATLLAYAGLAAIALWPRMTLGRAHEKCCPDTKSLLVSIARTTALLSAVAVAWAATSLFVLPTCPSLR